ncbi:putative interleukin-27 subunit beta [Scophthalmus maximus]|uniref:Putative interleukin-27 subunit beta n=1 Tax=Scophthalmus maximus TaxID=52904 RepID=A0A2U9CI59_SCOMX|nr:putative interleukin-27 subunit beta [Scophthalmus maximus]
MFGIVILLMCVLGGRALDLLRATDTPRSESCPGALLVCELSKCDSLLVARTFPLPTGTLRCHLQLWQCQLSDLKLLTDYIINVTAVHSGGSSSYLSSFMLEDIVRPDPPVDVRVSPHNGRDLLVEWSPPSTWNDLDIFPLKYQIMYQWEIRGIPKSVNLGPFESSKVELKGLSPGRTYLFRVCARELLGLGKFSSWSSPVNITIPRTKP